MNQDLALRVFFAFQRNRRIFGNLLKTLQQSRQDEKKVKDRMMKRLQIEKKIEERTGKEMEEARMQKRQLFVDRKKQQLEIKILQVKGLISASLFLKSHNNSL